MYQDRVRGEEKGREHESAGTCTKTGGEVRGEGDMRVQVHVSGQVER